MREFSLGVLSAFFISFNEIWLVKAEQFKNCDTQSVILKEEICKNEKNETRFFRYVNKSTIS